MITEKQAQTQWGDGLLLQLSHDLKSEFPEIKGLSSRSLKYAWQFYQFYKNSIGQQLVAQILWGHNILIIRKLKDLKEAKFYLGITFCDTTIVTSFASNSNIYSSGNKSIFPADCLFLG